MDLPKESTALRNQLLMALPEIEAERLIPHCTEVWLSLGQVLHEPQDPLTAIYFPHQAMISLVATLQDGSTTEVGVIGNDGVLGYPAFLGGRQTTSRAVVQIAGNATRIETDALDAEFQRGGALQKRLLLHTQALIAQISQTAVCNRFHPIEARLARWLLLAQNCANTSELQFTQDFLADMLGTRRASVTVAAGALQKAGAIHYLRGNIRILDRHLLETKACECYGVIHGEYERLLSIR